MYKGNEIIKKPIFTDDTGEKLDITTTTYTTGETKKDGVVQIMSERQIRSIMGCPVTRPIIDRQNNVILNVGDLITYKAVEKAKQADVIDILLNSVYH